MCCLWCRSVKKTILIKNLNKCKTYNAQQFITEFLNKGWTKNSINRLLVKFGTVDKRPDSSRCSAHTDENVDTVESLLMSQEDKPQSHWTVREISHEVGDPSIICFADYSQSSASQELQEKTRSTADWSMHALISVCSLTDNNVITWKLNHANSILYSFEYFCQIASKWIQIISSYTVQSWIIFWDTV